jgi:hypothetical protein
VRHGAQNTLCPEVAFLPTNQPEPRKSTRRIFLKRGLAGGLLLALGGVGFFATRRSKLVPLPKEPLRTLDEREYAVVHAIASRMIPPREGAPSIDDLGVGLTVDRILQRTTEADRKDFKRLLALFESAALNLRASPFTQLGPEEQDAALHAWQDSSITLRRTGFQAIRTIVMASYYARPETWKLVGYDGPPLAYYDKDAPVWKGGGVPRPPGNGVMPREEEP